MVRKSGKKNKRKKKKEKKRKKRKQTWESSSRGTAFLAGSKSARFVKAKRRVFRILRWVSDTLPRIVGPMLMSEV